MGKLLSSVYHPSVLGKFLGNQKTAFLSLFQSEDFQLIIFSYNKYPFYASGGEFGFPKFTTHVSCFSLQRDILCLIFWVQLCCFSYLKKQIKIQRSYQTSNFSRAAISYTWLYTYFLGSLLCKCFSRVIQKTEQAGTQP